MDFHFGHGPWPNYKERRILLLELDHAAHIAGGNIRREKGARPVVLRPVELDAAGDPRAGETDEGRLDNVLPVEEIVVAIGFVLADENAPADLRQEHEPHEFVLQADRLVFDRLRFVEDLVDERHRVDLAAGPLVDAFLEEHGVLLRGSHRIGRQRQRLNLGNQTHAIKSTEEPEDRSPAREHGGHGSPRPARK